MPTIDPRKKQEQNWKRRYGMTRRAYDKLLRYQNGVCAVCGGPPDTEDEVLAIDHDHQTGKVRGLLCKGCNTALGNTKDSPERLERLRLYIETHTVRPTVPAIAGDTPQGPEALVRAHALPAEPVTAPDPRIPTPEVIAALKGHGLSTQEIAEEFNLDRPTVKALYTESQRSSRIEAARDLLMEKALPHALVTITQAVQDGDAKTSVALIKGLGVLRDRAEGPKESNAGAVNFEQWRASLTGITVERERITATLDPSGGEEGTLDAETVGGVSGPAEAAAPSGTVPGGPVGYLREGPRPETAPAAPASSAGGFRTV